MTMDVASSQLSRKALIYLRQSTIRQVIDHTESTRRQYQLKERAVRLGWPEQRVQVIDEDLGRSGASASWRPGFQRLAEAVAHGDVGAVFALEVSRFARSNADWHRLLELCGWSDTLIGDEDKLYDPRDPNDRLLLGLKGQMSEAERYWMRLRMDGAKRSLARRGELRLVPPTGYIWDAEIKRLRKDPDEEVRRAISLIFERFRIDGSASGVVRSFIDGGLEVPARRIGQPVSWGPPRLCTVLGILKNPIYSGAYVYGRREARMACVDGDLRRVRVRRLPQEKWTACLRDRHPGYINWDEFMDNQNQLQDNRQSPAPRPRGAARRGGCLLQGLVLCGRCGQAMGVFYPPTGPGQYLCRSGMLHGTATRPCWRVSSSFIDDAVVEAFLDVVQPTQIDLTLSVAREAESQATAVESQWHARLERLRYQARLAERRYKAVDPDNRTVARTLEHEWETQLRALETAQGEYAELQRRHHIVLSQGDLDRIRALATDLSRVWAAPTTTNAQRKTLLRLLILQVTLTPIEVPQRQTRVQLLWESGAATESVVPRPLYRSGTQASASAEQALRTAVDAGKSDDEVAELLNDKGLVTGSKRPWTPGSVSRVRRRLGLAPNRRIRTSDPAVREDGLLSTRGVAERLGVAEHVVRYWRRKGELVAVEGGDHRRSYWYRFDESEEQRLRALLSRHAHRRKSPSPPSSGDAS